MPEMIVVLVIVILVFGAGKLPEVGSALGKSIKNFKKASEEDKDAPSRLEDKDDNVK